MHHGHRVGVGSTILGAIHMKNAIHKKRECSSSVSNGSKPGTLELHTGFMNRLRSSVDKYANIRSQLTHTCIYYVIYEKRVQWEFIIVSAWHTVRPSMHKTTQHTPNWMWTHYCYKRYTTKKSSTPNASGNGMNGALESRRAARISHYHHHHDTSYSRCVNICTTFMPPRTPSMLLFMRFVAIWNAYL